MAKPRALSRQGGSSPPQPRPSTSRLSHKMRQVYSQTGHWIGSHQMLSLLFSSLLISTLLTPALLLYLSPYGSPASSILRLSRGALPWELEGLQRQGVLWSEESVCWERIAGHLAEGAGRGGSAIEAEQLLVGPTAGGSAAQQGQAVSKETLHKASKVKRELERRLLAGDIKGLTCVRTAEGRCAISSPTDWWQDEAEILSDTDVHRTLSQALDPQIAGLTLPLTPTSTLVGAVRDRHGHLRGADYLALTFYLEPTAGDDPTHSSLDDHDEALRESLARDRAKNEWRKAVREVVGGKGWASDQVQLGKMSTTTGAGQKVMLKHLPRLPVQANPRLLENSIFALCFALVFVHVYMSVRDAAVHSKIGLLFTAAVELVASGVISLSVCWLLGISIGLIPAALVPLLVLVCGVDSMNILVNAVASTSLAQPIPERIAAAFADVGPSMVGTLVGELVIAWAIQMLVDVAIWKEITSLVLVILIVDFVLEIVFFTPVLSIDIQRLELADLIRQNPNHQMPSTPSEQGDRASFDEDSFDLGAFLSSTFAVLKARPARAATFATLIGINMILYSSYGPEHYLPAFCSEVALSANPHRLSPALASDLATALRRGQRGQLHDVPKDAGQAFWSLLNPSNASSVRVYVEPVTAITFFSDATAAPESIGATFVGGTSTLAKASIVLGPIVGTTGVLYLLLLYLLKDAELLAMKRLYSRKAREESRKPKGPPAAGVSLAQLKGRHLADVELLASSKEVIVSWAGLDDKLVVWRSRAGGDSFEAETLQLPLTAGPASLVQLALDGESTFCAAATSSGKILVWELDRKLLIDFSQDAQGGVANLGPAIALFASPASASKNTPAPPAQKLGNASPKDAGPPQAFFAVYGKGEIAMYDCVACSCAVVFRPPQASLGLPSSPTGKIRTLIATPTSPTLWPIYVRAESSGKVQVYRSEGGRTAKTWPLLAEIDLGSAEDSVTAVAYGEFVLGSGSIKPLKTVLVLGTLSGQLLAADLSAEGPAKHQLLADVDGAVKQIRLAPPPKGSCPTCAEPFGDGFQVIASTRQALSVIRVSSLVQAGPTPGSGQCLCSSPSASGAMARSGSAGSLAGTPKRKHRRASSSRSTNGEESTPTRPSRSSLYGGGSPNPSLEEDPALGALSPINLPPAYTPSKPAGVPLFNPAVDLGEAKVGEEGAEGEQAWAELCILRVASTRIDERGGWDLLDRAVVGVRRHKPSSIEKDGVKAERSVGGTSWEVWSVPLAPVPLGPCGSDQIGAEGRTALEALTRRATQIEQPDSPVLAPAPQMDNSLRRRHVASVPPVSSPLRPRANTALNGPSIRFEDVALPFSRARPVISALGEEAIALGLGNSIAVLSAAGKSAGANRWAGGLLGLTRSESGRGLGGGKAT